MKKISILVALLFFIVNFSFGESRTWQILTDSVFYDYDLTQIKILKKSTFVQSKNSSSDYAYAKEDGRYYLSINSDGLEGVVLSNTVGIPTSMDLFDNSLITMSIKDDSYILAHLFDILKDKNRDAVYKYEPNAIKEYQKNKDDSENDWWYVCAYYFGGVRNLVLTNVCLEISNILGQETNFSISTINKKSYGYKVNAICNSLTQYDPSCKIEELPIEKNKVDLLLKIDGDYIYIYLNTFDVLFGIFSRANDVTIKEYQRLMIDNTCDLSKVTWPRHADGTCDYDDSAKPVGTKYVPPAPSSSSISVAGTTKRVTTNLRLRSTEDTSSTVITTMQKGTAVKIIKTGSQDTIDGITSNWVQVEVQAGAKDRNGKPITAGTTGWCFGGYLE
jgi:hypothetical protein